MMRRSFKVFISLAIVCCMFFSPFSIHAKTLTISNTAELEHASKLSAGNDLIVLIKDGTYVLKRAILISGNNISYKGVSGSSDKVVIKGNGHNGSIDSVFKISGKNIAIENLKIGEVKRHAIQIHGEKSSGSIVVRNVHFYDTGEQMLKGSYDKNKPESFISNVLIEDCLFEFTRGKAFQYYTAGIDVHHGENWEVKNSVFKNINNPQGQLTEGAIHFWNHSRNITVTGNKIINCDRGVLFGLDNSPLYSGLITNNFIHTVADTGIYLCNASGVKVLNNTVFIDSGYPNAIEYRFKDTINNLIANNLSNKEIRSRDGGSAKVENNVVSARKDWFVNAAKGDLHLDDRIASVHGKGLSFPEVEKDIDGQDRESKKIDIGADQNDNILPKTIQKISLTVDKSLLWNDGIDIAQFDVQGTYKDGKIKSVEVDQIACVNEKNHSIDTAPLSFLSDRSGIYRFQAKLNDLSSNIIEVEVRDILSKQVTGLEVSHRQGQTFLTFDMITNYFPESDVTYAKYFEKKKQLDKHIYYKIYRSTQPIEDLDMIDSIATINSFSGWNESFYGKDMWSDRYSRKKAIRYVVKPDGKPLEADKGLFVYSPLEEGEFFYAVTAVVNDRENNALVMSRNTLKGPVHETIGQGVPVLQRVETPELFQYIKKAKLYFYTRWESPPNTGLKNKPFDYLVAVPENVKKPAPVGIHLHGWGGNLLGDYAWWNNAEKGSILLSSTQDPYDWWTGYEENFYSRKKEPGKKNNRVEKVVDNIINRIPSFSDSKDGSKDRETRTVRPYTINRLFSFLDFLANESQWPIDLTQTFTAGSSMGGSGSLMIAIRYPDRIAWARSWVGVHIPGKSPQFKSSYIHVWGNPEENVKFEDGTPVWDYFNDAKYLYAHPEKEVGFLTFSNGKNDGAIGWAQAVEFLKALQDTRRPHLFIWGQEGHGQRTVMPENGSQQVMPIDIRTDVSLPAFTNCSLDNNPGNGDPSDGDPNGQINRWLYWHEKDITDSEDNYQITVALMDSAPESTCSVDVTPRKVQRFKPEPGEKLYWASKTLLGGKMVQAGEMTADKNGLFTLASVVVSKKKNRLVVSRNAF
ncbi:MAG: right-handed parallel beta-helix repeat-containing protein [Desulfobacterium sp.]|nr:right-handed parallel beta-helix repeat-containing protein [Desulfobacterium sp.]